MSRKAQTIWQVHIYLKSAVQYNFPNLISEQRKLEPNRQGPKTKAKISSGALWYQNWQPNVVSGIVDYKRLWLIRSSFSSPDSIPLMGNHNGEHPKALLMFQKKNTSDTKSEFNRGSFACKLPSLNLRLSFKSLGQKWSPPPLINFAEQLS